MSLNEEVDLLRQIPLFSKIDPSKLKLLAFTSERLTFGSGQDLFQQGDVGDTAYIIIEGKAEAEVLVVPCLSGCHPHPLHIGCSQSPE